MVKYLTTINLLSHSKNHWFLHLNNTLGTIGLPAIYNFNSVEVLLHFKADIIERWTNHLRSQDVNRILNSKYNPFFRQLTAFGEGERYITERMPIKQQRVLCQLRLSNINLIRIFLNGERVSINASTICDLCNTKEPLTLVHFLLKCPIYRSYRKEFLAQYIDRSGNEEDSLARLLNIIDGNQLKNMFKFVECAIKMRNFILDLYET